MTAQFTISPNGEITFVYNDDFAGLISEGEAKIERASHVEPNSEGRWQVDMTPSGGSVLEETFALRADALKAEVAWLYANRF